MAGTAVLLRQLSNLKRLDSPHLLEAIHSMPEPPASQIKTVVLSSEWNTRLDIVGVLAKGCPGLTSLSISHLYSNQEQRVPGLSNLRHLSNLHIGGIDFKTLLGLLSCQKANGVFLTSLSYVNTFSLADVGMILALSPQLTSLQVDACSLARNEALDPACARRLKKLRLKAQGLIPYSIWSELLLSCPQLTSFDVTSCEGYGHRIQDTFGAVVLPKDERSVPHQSELCQHFFPG